MIDTGAPAITYCYDNADRLISTSDSRYSGVSYDARGNPTQLGTSSMTYDSQDRHMSTTKDTTTVSYQRDATDRITKRSVNSNDIYYSYSADGDAADQTMVPNSSGGWTTLDRNVGLLGGVVFNSRFDPATNAYSTTWSYPDVSGHVIATADGGGFKQGATKSYDPYGTPLTTNPDNQAGNFDFGWHGGAAKQTEAEAGIDVIEMGARQYAPGLGRFLEVDPIDGGSANDYGFTSGDPVNAHDHTGLYEVVKNIARTNVDGSTAELLR